jgi:hypothetical protein
LDFKKDILPPSMVRLNTSLSLSFMYMFVIQTSQNRGSYGIFERVSRDGEREEVSVVNIISTVTTLSIHNLKFKLLYRRKTFAQPSAD